MKKNESTEPDDEMQAVYDFRGAIRGRHYKPLHEGYTIEIHKTDGTTVVEHHKPNEGAVFLEPDVQEWFPDSAAVNQALRSLIQLMKQMPETQQHTNFHKEKAKAT